MRAVLLAGKWRWLIPQAMSTEAGNFVAVRRGQLRGGRSFLDRFRTIAHDAGQNIATVRHHLFCSCCRLIECVR
jgi:hypothetical protein